ncbi:MAG: histidinol-phosphate transaminase [Acidobacteria bacterium SCN 69-37]|nr:MAG: histidinol-phosphate transaminase [Acidobacteria bacterium SCN 69-37]
MRSLIRPLVRALHPYVPGEQPKIRGLIKLNTNENPYPPSPKVLAAITRAVDVRLRLYPNPTSQRLRERLARLHRCRPEQVFIGNGSDECLALAVRAFVEPVSAARRGAADPRATVQYFRPSYSLYPVLADTHGAARNEVPLAPDFSLPGVAALRRGRAWRFDAALTLVTTPNAPSGRGYTRADLDALCRAQRGVVLLDEAYADFADEHALPLALEHAHVLVARTFSKSYSLCFQRVGYVIGHPTLIAALDAIRDSYNVNGLGQVAAEATLADLPYYRAHIATIVRTREALGRTLATIGFEVLPSQTNFLLVRPPVLAARTWLERLRDRRILVRWFDTPELRDALRITVGTDREAAALVRAARQILRDARRSVPATPVRRATRGRARR